MGPTNELEKFVPPYRTVAHSIPPIPHMGTGIPHGSMLDSYFNKFSALDMVPGVEPRVNKFGEFYRNSTDLVPTEIQNRQFNCSQIQNI
jgi:hypothetical protein